MSEPAYHRSHLEVEGAPLAEWMKLVSPEWHQAWQSQPQGWTGFLDDVRRAHAEAVTAALGATDAGPRARALTALVRCALVEASLLTMAPPAPAEAGDEPGAGDRPAIGDSGSQARALLALSAEVRSPAERRLVVLMALDAARVEPDASALVEVARAMHSPDREVVAREAVQAIRASTTNEAALLLLDVAPALAEAEAPAILREAIARMATHDPSRGWPSPYQFAERAGTSLPERLVDVLWQAAGGLQGVDRGYLLAWLAPRLPEASRARGLKEALELALSLPDPGFEPSLRRLAPHLDESLWQEASTATTGNERRSSLVRRLSSPRREQPAADVLRRLKKLDPGARSLELQEHGARLLREIGADDALALARELPETWRARSLARLGAHLPEPSRHAVIAEALAMQRGRPVPQANPDELTWMSDFAGDMDAPSAAVLFCQLLGMLVDGSPTYDRADMLYSPTWTSFAKLAPLLGRAGGDDALVSAAREIVAVASWFP